MRWLTPTLVVALVILAAAPAGATWSVVGVDPDTGQVGVAVASCVELGALEVEDGFELVALSPGNGAGVSQAWFNPDARLEIQRLLDDGRAADEIIAAVSDLDFDAEAEERQHGVVLLNGDTAGFTGKGNNEVARDVQGENVSVQGNVLVSDEVISDAVVAFERDGDRSLSDRLVDALEAGSRAGGDSRCGDQTALFAHVSVIDDAGTREAPNVVDLTTWTERGDGDNPVVALAELHRAGTRFLTPDAEELPSPGIPAWLWLVPLVLGGVLVGFWVFTRRAVAPES